MPEGSDEGAGLDDFDRIVASLNKHAVDFMIVGGYAVIFHGHIRATKDLDLLIRRTPENSRRTVVALEEMGFTCPDLKPELFMAGKGITFGEPPLRVDVLGDIRGVEFDEAWPRKRTGRFGPNEANFIGLDDLIANKQSVARPQDLADVQKLSLARDKRSQEEKESQTDDTPGLEP